MRDVVDILREITDEGGLNVPASTICFYSDLSTSAVSSWIRGESYPTVTSENKLREGIRKYQEAMEAALDGLYN